MIAPFLNLLFAYAAYMISRIVYVWENWGVFGPEWGELQMGELIAGSLRFDTAAICYTLAIYMLLMLLPLPCSHRRWWQRMCKAYYMTAVGGGVVTNLADAVYSQYTGRRTTSSFFSEFANDGNIGSIVGIEVLRHWYLVVIGVGIVVGLWFCYRPATDRGAVGRKRAVGYYATKGLLWLSVIPLSIGGIRGGFSTAIRPITISNANQYVNSPTQAAIVLNTPFALIRTIGKTTFENPAYFSATALEAIYTPVHEGCGSGEGSAFGAVKGANVVVIILESFGTEYFGFFNSYNGYTPFLDSLIGQSLTFDASYSNGRKSIDAMPSILSSIPMFVEPFVVTPYSLNEVGGLAHELSKDGYQTAFFHGAENGSMGFEAFARATGFSRYCGRDQYCEFSKSKQAKGDEQFNGMGDFDGTWAIWDQPFMQYYAMAMSEMREPFCTAVFTASSHHPFAVPEQYKVQLKEAGHPIYTCIRYTDMALQHFFQTAQKQAWYNNTIFVITADHTNISEQAAYGSDIGGYKVPIVIYDPSGRLPRGRSAATAQQIDIMPTVLSAVGHEGQYIAFGQDLLSTAAKETWAVNYLNGIYQYVEQGYLLQFDGQEVVGLYHLEQDKLLRSNLSADPKEQERKEAMTMHLKAIIQSYMERMIGDSLVVK